ncbi:MAG: hypothetical protein O2865_07920 [Planctomycetota bacterium]|nr:hypothetical protein [Planctomycetota bacterium]MDA0932925.1 hypothetical protein [Planctomycetota bacterium]MDA1222831.1 hypothetical protein [Planctomycetota bacterium]
MRRLPLWPLVLVAGCATDPVPFSAAPVGAHGTVEVRLLEGGFVAVDGERMTVEEMQYALRVRCRAAAAGSAPAVRVVAPPGGGAEHAALVTRIREAAFDAGVGGLEFVTAGDQGES